MTVPLSDTVDVSVNAGAGSIRPAPEKNMVRCTRISIKTKGGLSREINISLRNLVNGII
jgi:hypothetical protein